MPRNKRTLKKVEKDEDTEEDHKSNGISVQKCDEIQVIEAPDWPCNLVDTETDVGMTILCRLFHWGPLLALGIIFTIGLTTIITHLEYFPITQPLALLDMSIFLYFNYGVLVNLIQASYVGGGYISRGWRPPNAKDTSRLQFCASCGGYKAPRSHHCKKCNRCVMKMDHHCPWINNCVGHRNHTTFVKFLFFAVVGCLHALLILGYILYHTLSVLFYRNSHPIKRLNPYIIRSLTSFIFILLSVSFSVGVIIAVGVLLYTQICAVLKNKTAIEDYICAKVVYRGGAEDFTYPYDLGFRRNFREVFPSLFASQPRGNGIWWPIHSNCTQFTLSMEQLIQKTNKRYAAHIYEITESHIGGAICACRAGMRVFFCQPCSDEPRIEIEKGEAYAVTRINKHWIYGQRLLHVSDSQIDHDDDIHGPFSENPYLDRLNRDKMAIKQALEPRGWFPKKFAKHRPRPRMEDSS